MSEKLTKLRGVVKTAIFYSCCFVTGSVIFGAYMHEPKFSIAGIWLGRADKLKVYINLEPDIEVHRTDPTSVGFDVFGESGATSQHGQYVWLDKQTIRVRWIMNVFDAKPLVDSQTFHVVVRGDELIVSSEGGQKETLRRKAVESDTIGKLIRCIIGQ